MDPAPLTEAERAKRIRMKLATGELRIDSPSTILRQLGVGHPCTACGRMIESPIIEAECLWIGVTHRFDPDCFAEWDRQRRKF